MTRPLIGITTTRDTKDASGTRDVLRQVYSLAIIRAGGLAVLLPNEPSSCETLTHCQGLLLTGGGDYDPIHYGQKPDGTQVAGVNADRDTTELALIRTALSLKMPILGICRGMQGLAVAGQGTLIQDIATRYPHIDATQHAQQAPRAARTHRVAIEPHTILAQLIGESSIMVNSFHHQAVDRVPAGYRMAARAEDGIIEAFEDPARPFVIGVQWHPEDLAHDQLAAQRLFAGFIRAAEVFQEPAAEHPSAARSR